METLLRFFFPFPASPFTEALTGLSQDRAAAQPRTELPLRVALAYRECVYRIR